MILQEVLTLLQQQVQELTQELESKEVELQNLTQENKSLTQEVKELTTENELLQQQLIEEQNTCTNITNENLALMEQIEKLNNALESSTATDLVEALTTLNADLKNSKLYLSSLELNAESYLQDLTQQLRSELNESFSKASTHAMEDIMKQLNEQ